MAIPPKEAQIHTFEQNSDADTSPFLFPNNKARRQINTRVMTSGDRGVVMNLMGNLLITNGFLPDGNNIGLGYGKNEEKGKLYYFNWNEDGYHGIFCYDGLTGGITPVLRNLIDTNNVDILRFSPDYLINHVDIVTDKLIYWVDGLNKARKFNINKAIDKTITGYGDVIIEDFITAYKKTGIYAPVVEYFTDLTRTNNYLYAKQFKFTYRYYYDDGEISNWSDWSGVAYPPNESYLGQNAITFANNGLQVTVETGDRLVKKIEIAVAFTAIDLVAGTGFVSCVVLNKKQLNIPDYGNYTYSFYNDGSYILLDQAKVIRPFNYMPRVPKTQSFVKVAMTYGNAAEGYDEVQVLATVDLTFNPIFIPDGEVDQLNNPSISITLLSTTKHKAFLGSSWWTTVTRFIIGSDVKAGNKFQVNVTGGHAPRHFEYLATLSDSSSTVANAIKQWLRTIDGAGTGTFTNENLIGGNENWDFTIEAHAGDNAIQFSGSVNPVNYATLKDNGFSVNVIKQGSVRKYGFVYSDDDQREEPTYTADSLLVKTPFQTEVLLGQTAPIGLQQAVHTLSVYHQPPVWAKWYRIVRSKDTDTFIELLIQQVNTVEVANEDTYLDMVVGSLFTYQKIHPDTILKYDFERGDRLRLISDNSGDTPVPYQPYFETEILNYSTNTEEPVNANILVDSTDHVQPDKAVDPNYIGKYIVINGVERLITAIDGAKYVLDRAFKPNLTYGDGAATSVVYPNYKFVDRRGIIRIKKPTGYNIVNLSLIEVYRPQQNANNQNYQDFFDFQQKFEVLNYGTDARAHQGNIQNQVGNTPAKIQITQGDSFIRNRAMPSNNQDPNPQVIIDKISDPNFSDFYTSNLYSTGRIYPQAQATGRVEFGSRIRFSNNYIEDTQINGLNDFDNLDRKDYNDPYGTITRTLFRGDYLYVFKQLCPAWTPVGKKIITDNSGQQLLATSDKLLNDLQYSELECGIGSNGEGLVVNKGAMYIPSAYAGVFVRIAQNGSIAISEKYFYDSVARDILSNVSKYNLRVYGGYCSEHGEVHWTIPPFIKYDFNNAFNAGDWQTVLNDYPDGTTFAITQQPANSSAAVVGGTIEITGTSTLGNDFFKFQGTMPGGALTPVMTFCFTVVADPNRITAWVGDDTTLYCLQTGPNNNGQQGVIKLKQVYQDDNSSVGFIMPNVNLIAPEAIVPDTAAITYNFTDIVPSGGADGDVWYNQPSDALYKKVSGVWSLLTDRVPNDNYQAPIQNLTDCPIPPTAIGRLLVDILGNTTSNLYAYIDTPGTGAAYQNPAYTGKNFVPNLGVANANDCYVLASDNLAGPPTRRFAFNWTKLINDFPTILSFKGVIAGRDTAANTLSGSYSNKTVGMLTMGGSPGSYIPGVPGSSIVVISYSSAAPMATGADGTYGIGIGAPILTFVYDVLTNTVTLS